MSRFLKPSVICLSQYLNGASLFQGRFLLSFNHFKTFLFPS